MFSNFDYSHFQDFKKDYRHNFSVIFILKNEEERFRNIFDFHGKGLVMGGREVQG